MKWFISQETIRSDFRETLEKVSGVELSHCYQCGKCSAGCPIAPEMEYLPNQIIRMAQLGMESQVLNSNTMWLCASCITCTARCPREIDIAEIMDALRRIAYRKGIVSAREANLPLFNRIFLRNIEKFGRLYELWLIGTYNLLSGEFFKDLTLAPAMFLKGKISLFPAVPQGAKELKAVFARAGRLEHARRRRLIIPWLWVLTWGRKVGRLSKSFVRVT